MKTDLSFSSSGLDIRRPVLETTYIKLTTNHDDSNQFEWFMSLLTNFDDFDSFLLKITSCINDNHVVSYRKVTCACHAMP